MSYTSNYNLNIRLSNLESKINGGGIPTSSTLADVLTNGNSAGANDIDLNNQDILQVDNIDLVTINGSAYPPVVSADDLSAVLTAGNSATNSIILNNSGTGTNVINLLPNASASNPNITLTDGTITNTIDKNGYTTRNSVQNSTHFLNFSDASATGTRAIQKTTGIECNPSTKTITATTFNGAFSGTATNATNVAVTEDNTSNTFYPTFVSATGNQGLKIDSVTTPFSYNASNGFLTVTAISAIIQLSTSNSFNITSVSNILNFGSVNTRNSFNFSSFTLTQNVTGFNFGANFRIYNYCRIFITGGASTFTISKSLTGGTIYSNFATALSITAGQKVILDITYDGSSYYIMATSNFTI